MRTTVITGAEKPKRKQKGEQTIAKKLGSQDRISPQTDCNWQKKSGKGRAKRNSTKHG